MCCHCSKTAVQDSNGSVKSMMLGPCTATVARQNKEEDTRAGRVEIFDGEMGCMETGKGVAATVSCRLRHVLLLQKAIKQDNSVICLSQSHFAPTSPSTSRSQSSLPVVSWMPACLKLTLASIRFAAAASATQMIMLDPM